MINDKLLLRNKRIADYALDLCKKLGLSEEYSGKKIYSYLLMYNTDFQDADFNNQKQMKNIFNYMIYDKRKVFEKFVEYDYLQKQLNVIHLSILHFDKDGNEVDINTKLKEIKEYFGENSSIYNVFTELANYYYPKLISDKKITLKFSGIVENKIKEYDIDFSCKMNDEIFSELILYLISNYSYLKTEEIINHIKEFLYIHHIECNQFDVNERSELNITKINSIINNKEININTNADYFFNFSIIDEKVDKNYEWAGLIDIKINDDRKYFACSYSLDEKTSYTYYYKNGEHNDYYKSDKQPLGFSNYFFKLLVPYIVDNDIKTTNKKVR